MVDKSSWKEAVDARNVNNAWIYVLICKSCVLASETLTPCPYLMAMLSESLKLVSTMVQADSAILCLSLVAKSNQPFLAWGLDVPRRGYYWKISCRELFWMVIASLAKRIIMWREVVERKIARDAQTYGRLLQCKAYYRFWSPLNSGSQSSVWPYAHGPSPQKALRSNLIQAVLTLPNVDWYSDSPLLLKFHSTTGAGSK